jgi:transposase
MSTQTATPSATPAIRELSEEQLDGLMVRIREARDHNLALSGDDYDVLMSAMLMLANMQERLNNNDLTLTKLKKLMGMVSSSEKLGKLRPSGSGEGAENKPARPKGSHGRKSARKRGPSTTPIKPTVHHHTIDELSKGDSCPGCSLGRVYKYDPATLLRITAHSPFTREQHVAEQLRCNGCGEIFTAELPEQVRTDGRVDQQYGYSAIAMMGIQRYFGGSPLYRQETLQQLFGVHIAASTQFDQCQKLSDACQPVFQHLKLLAADAQRFYLDDTTNRILNKGPIEKERAGRTQWRSGVYTSAALAECMIKEPGSGPPEQSSLRRLVLFQTNIGHAGEWLDELLRARTPNIAKPVLMSDALSSNHVTEADYDKALCNVHSRRGFAELVEQHPEMVVFALECYEPVWANESHCKRKTLDSAQRLAYHREHSLPHMLKLKGWCEEQLSESGAVEPNSNLGKAMAYVVRHFDGLSAFCRILNAPVDNNEIERLIKLIVRSRKNSLFFKTQNGADVSDVITSMLATSAECNANAFDYLQCLQRNQLAVRAAPEKWMPWNYPIGR